MGEKQTKPFQLSFNGLLKVDFQGSHVTSDGGLILVRELDERLGLGELIDEHLSDSRQGTNKQFTLADLLRQSVYSRLAGYEDLNDAERISIDPTFRLIGSQKIWDRGAALTSTLHGFETEMLASEENLLGLMALNRELVGQAEAFDDSERVVLDMDSTESPVHGQQEGSAYNGQSSRSAITRYFCSTVMVIASLPSCVPACAQRRGLSYCCRRSSANRLRASRSPCGAMRPLPNRKFMRLRRNAEYSTPFAFRPTRAWSWRSKTSCFGRREGPPGSLVRYKSFRYQAESWSKARRIVAKVELTRASCSRGRIHRDEHELAKPLGGTLLQQARHGGAVDEAQGHNEGCNCAGPPAMLGLPNRIKFADEATGRGHQRRRRDLNRLFGDTHLGAAAAKLALTQERLLSAGAPLAQKIDSSGFAVVLSVPI